MQLFSRRNRWGGGQGGGCGTGEPVDLICIRGGGDAMDHYTYSATPPSFAIATERFYNGESWRAPPVTADDVISHVRNKFEAPMIHSFA
jgi:hypothetical protein